ncbi:MAG: glycosyltransferase family 4 protein [Bacteroidales bacterium]|nr:glycosyltransferase family 4 protein [Bacteroidales bacterium]
MKILQVVQSLGKGGAERLVLEISQAIKKYYPLIENKIVSLSPKNEYETLSKGLDIVYCGSYVNLSILGHSDINIAEYENIVENYKPDVIHSHTYTAELVSREHVREHIIYVTHCHNNMPEFSRFKLSCLYRKSDFTRLYEKIRMERRYRSCKNRFVAISADTVKYYKRNMNKSLIDNVLYLPNAIDYHKFYSPIHPDEKSEILNLIMVGHMSDNKNQIFLLDVLKCIKDRIGEAHLTLVGDWRNNGEKILQKSKILGLEDDIDMPGLVEDVETIYFKNHIYVHSSYSEALGLTLIEAMAAGLPVVTLDGKGNRDLIEEGKNGYMIYEQNPKLFADKILEIWNDKQKYQEMSLFAQEYAKQYDIVPYVDRLLEIYSEK